MSDSGRSHTLQANDELDKRHWLQCIDEALSREVLPVASDDQLHRRPSSSASSTDTLSADFHSPSVSAANCSTSVAARCEDCVEPRADSTLSNLPPVSQPPFQVTKCI